MDGSATPATICIGRIGLDGRVVNARTKGIPRWACPVKKQNFLQCEMMSARKALKSGDPSDLTLAILEPAAPPSPVGPQPRRARLPHPVQAGAPAWMSPGLLRSPLNTRASDFAGSKCFGRFSANNGRRQGPGGLVRNFS